MDSARKITKSNSLLSKSKKNCSKISIKNSNLKTQEEIEDHRLRNWKKWLENREKTCNRLKSLTGRRSEDLLINSYEKIRPKIEIQNLLEAAALSVLPEKSNDEINFWTTPVYLKNRRDPENPEIAVSLTKKQLKLPRILSQVFLPELAQKEKCLSLPKPPALAQKHNEYLRRKLKELSPQISKLNLKIRDIHRVAVEGKKIPHKKQIILKINDEEIIFNQDSMKKPESLIFSVDFFSKNHEKSEKLICLENKTFKNLIYEWQEPVFDHQELKKKSQPKFFHFEKPSDTILPGRCAELIIRYCPQSPGAHLESIILDTSPKLCLSSIVLSLWGVCEEPSRYPNRIIDYNDYLDFRFRNSIICEIIEDIWQRVESPPPQLPPYALYFLESEVFILKNPTFFHYNFEIIEELKKMFQIVVNSDSWALSISQLQYHLLQAHDANVTSKMLNKFVKLCRGLRQPSRWELLTNSKHQVVYNLVAGFVSKFSVESEYIKSHCTRGKWGEFMLERVQDDVSRCSDVSCELDNCESRWKRGRWAEGRGWTPLSGSTGSIVSDIEEYWNSGGHEGGIYDTGLYYEVFYTRIYHLLGDTADKISAAVETINHFNRREF